MTLFLMIKHNINKEIGALKVGHLRTFVNKDQIAHSSHGRKIIEVKNEDYNRKGLF